MVVIFKDPGGFFHRERTMYERPFGHMLVFRKGTLSLAKLLLNFILHWGALRSVLINFIQIMRTGVAGKFKCYGIYTLVYPFIDRQPVNWLKLFAGYMMSFFQLQAKLRTLILFDSFCCLIAAVLRSPMLRLLNSWMLQSPFSFSIISLNKLDWKWKVKNFWT